MEKRPRRPGLMERASQALDLPADLLAGLPRLELIGDCQLRMENHKGILSYRTEEICVSGGAFLVRIRGEGLDLKAMTGLELLVCGRIMAVTLE